MIPQNISEPIEITTYPSLTYALSTKTKRIIGMIDGKAAIEQAIYKALNTERFGYGAYSQNYGAELYDLIGKPKTYALSEIKRRITECVMWDSRIESVDNFEFEINQNKISCTFDVKTIAGIISVAKDVIV